MSDVANTYQTRVTMTSLASDQCQTQHALRVQARAYASEDGVLTERMMDEIVADSVKQHARKVQWQRDQEKAAQEAGVIDSAYRSDKHSASVIPKSQEASTSESGTTPSSTPGGGAV